MSTNVKFVNVPIRIPNLDGDGIAETLLVRVPVTIDPLTGEEILTEEAIEMLESAKARYMGLMRPEDIRELRESLNLTQKEISELIQSGEKSYTRWETGKARVSRLVNVLLCSIRDGFLPLTYLRTLCNEGSDWFKTIKEYDARHKKVIVYPVSAQDIAMVCVLAGPVVVIPGHQYALEHAPPAIDTPYHVEYM